MKKVLIIAYFFPPANFAGSYRAASWAKYLHEFGYYPVIVTRCWNSNQTDITSKVQDNTYSEVKSETCHIIRTPYRNTLRDQLHNRSSGRFLQFIRRFLTFSELILQNFFLRTFPYVAMYRAALKHILIYKDIDIILVTGRPFHSFFFGYLLTKITGIPWVADYRDEWSTSKLVQDRSVMQKIIWYLEKKHEKKWLSNATGFISCSEDWLTSIGTFIHKQGYTVLNGYDPVDYQNVTFMNKMENEYWIVYNGTLYPSQPIEVFLEAILTLTKVELKDKKLVLFFPGIQVYPIQEQRIRSFMTGSGVDVRYYSRLPKSEVISLQKSADLLLMIAHPGIKGNYSSKIFEYYACQVPILLCPSDHDVLEKFVREIRIGFVVDTVSECREVLEVLLNGQLEYSPDHSKGLSYTRKAQTEVLSNTLDKLLS